MDTLERSSRRCMNSRQAPPPGTRNALRSVLIIINARAHLKVSVFAIKSDKFAFEQELLLLKVTYFEHWTAIIQIECRRRKSLMLSVKSY